MLRSAPYTLRDVGGDLPRPATKVRRTEVSAGLDRPRPEVKQIGQLPPLPSAQTACSAAPRADVGPILPTTVVAARPLPSAILPGCSLAAAESEERRRLATAWLGFADVVRRDSKLFIDLGPCHTARLLPLFLDRAPATLRRHLSGWRAWLSFCASATWPACRPSLSQMLDFLASLSEGAVSDRGRRRRKTALGVLSALKFAAYKFQVEQLQSVLESPLVTAWQNSAEWTRQRVKEALSLPLVVLFRFEQALVNGAGEDCLLLSVLLVQAYAGPMCSDWTWLLLCWVAII